MTKIDKILFIKYGPERKYATVTALTDENDEVSIYVGGEIEVWFDPAHNKAKAHIKRNRTLTTKAKERTLDGNDAG